MHGGFVVLVIVCVFLLCFVVYIVFFFFKQKTAYEIYQCDWSSDVCSSDLAADEALNSRWARQVGHARSGRVAKLLKGERKG